MKNIHDFGNFKLYELNQYGIGTIVIIYYDIDGNTEPCKVKIKQIHRNNKYSAEFMPPLENHPPISISGDQIVDVAEEINEPMKPAWTGEQPMSTDYNPASNPNQMTNTNKITNDISVPNS